MDVQLLVQAQAQLIADVRFYPVPDAKPTPSFQLGWRCVCLVRKTVPLMGYEAWPILREPMYGGDERQLGFVFSSMSAVNALVACKLFYLWDSGRTVGEARVRHPQFLGPGRGLGGVDQN
jgi:hypothetical protein